MGIPRIHSYDMPLAPQLPRNRVHWSPRSERAVLLVHDLQDYFLEFYDKSKSPIPELLQNTRALIERARALGIPVVYTAQPADQPPEHRGLLNEMWGPGITAHPTKTGIEATLAPLPEEHVLTKWRYSAFYRTDLLELLHTWERDQLLITGIYAHIGCFTTANEAFMQNIETFFVADAMADFSPEQHQGALSQVADCCGHVTTTQALLDRLGATDSPTTH